VPEADPAKTNSLLSKADLFEPAVEERNNLYTYYKCLFPRFRHLHRRFFVVLFSDMFFHLNLLWRNITPLHNQEGSEYSQQILDLIPASEVRLVSFPKLASLFRGACQCYCESKDIVFAIAVESLMKVSFSSCGRWRRHIDMP
jgi:hypothetical protein